MPPRKPRELVRLLRDKGLLTDAAVAAAMAEVPREAFVPGYGPDEAYDDKVLITKRDAAGLAISAASQPAIVAIMLEQLQVEPGHRILEIGAGTGYNAALLGRLARDVVTVDIDEDVARQARERLSGVANVEVRDGDGWAGAADVAPFDRIELTASVSDVSPAWRDQLVPGGLIVLPLWLRVGVQVSVAFRRVGDTLLGESVRECGFQRLRGPHGGPEGIVPVGDGEFVVTDDVSQVGALRELLRSPPRTEPAPGLRRAVFSRLAMDEPRTFAITSMTARPPRPGMYDTGGLVLIDGDRMLTYGSTAARDRFLHTLVTTRPLDSSKLRISVAFEDPPPAGPGWRFVRPSCTIDVAEG